MDVALLTRIAEALERLAPPPPPAPDLTAADGFVWQPATGTLQPVAQIARIPLALLKGIDRQIDILAANTRQFAAGRPANNAMLWGARGSGKSSLVKAIHAAINDEKPGALALIEIHREDIGTLPLLLERLRATSRRILIFCDDLSFEREDADYKALKSVLDGGIEGRPANVLFYATSNRRHLMPRDMIENEASTAITPGEATEEKVSLSDRFGLWLGFHGCDQATYFAMVEAYAAARALRIDTRTLRAQAAEWATTRGARSGRVAFQFIEDLTGRLAT
jgi:predicted AAA+ superfamily ATPase